MSPLKYFSIVPLTLLCFFIFFLLITHDISAQSASGCARTVVGNPTGPTPTLPAICNGGVSGDFKFPLHVSDVTAVATEMASYPAGYSFGGHFEHAGVDIDVTVGAHVPVFAAASGTVIAARDACYDVAIGEQCRLDVSDDGDNYISSYTHVDVNPNVVIGSKITQGQQIAVVHYWTEYCCMDHLHFELQSKLQNDSVGVPININPRNHLAELQQWQPLGYGGTGADVRAYTDSVGLNWADDGKEFAETYKNHPPCAVADGCWAH